MIRKIGVLALALASIATATTSAHAASSPDNSGGASFDGTPTQASKPTVPGTRGKVKNGVAYAPSLAPLAVKRVIWAANKIRHKPYIFGGGHAAFIASGYDCSGSVSYVLHAAGLLATPFDSSDFMHWGQKGLGHWITVYTNPGHAFVQIAGIRLDTSAEGDPHPTKGTGPRWRPIMTSIHGFMSRHPSGY